MALHGVSRLNNVYQAQRFLDLPALKDFHNHKDESVQANQGCQSLDDNVHPPVRRGAGQLVQHSQHGQLRQTGRCVKEYQRRKTAKG